VSRPPSPPRLPLWPFLAALAALAAATLLLELPAVRFTEVSTPIAGIDLTDPAWTSTDRGISQPAPGTVELTSTPSGPRTRLVHPIAVDPAWSDLGVHATIAVTDVTHGDKRWHRPFINLRSRSATGEALDNTSFLIPGAEGSRDLGRISHVFDLPPGTDSALLRIFNAAASGTLTVSDLEVVGLTHSPTSRLARPVLITLWLVVLPATAWCLLPTFERRRLRLLVLAAAIALVVGAILPRGAYDLAVRATSRMSAALHSEHQHSADTAPGSQTGANENHIDSWLAHEFQRGRIANAGHVFGFLVFAALVLAARPPHGLRTAALIVLAFAGITEVLQSLTATRHANLGDILIDLAGAAVGLLIALPLSRGSQPSRG
jgi:hypothetical protein